MSAENTPDEPQSDDTAAEEEDQPTVRDRLGDSADRAATEFDQNVVDLLAWVLDTETRARIYVYLRQRPNSTSDEVAEGTGLYPSTVREALAELHGEERVTRQKRESAGAGNNPYEYEAIAPSELVQSVAEQVQSELNMVFNLDSKLAVDGDSAPDDSTPVTITVDGNPAESADPADD
ncbi:transcriptional regulator [Haloprofundus marisrubri]|uniref:Transcriptional regulator n=1 Tax=Haloprofundus marisrubri TaxID=1514971 RepID=A0A0W1RDD1_9EURY|nr:helix-turn-helix domain-containing protein [Haloprofundus marisrubri]KTG11266.1 transcriptional regulator [Haloprofundus marisrubri]